MKQSSHTCSSAMLLLFALAHSSYAAITGDSDAYVYTSYMGFKQVSVSSYTHSNSPSDYIVASYIGLEPCIGINSPWECPGMLDPVAIPPSGQAHKDFETLSPWLWYGENGCIQGWHGAFLRDEQDWLVAPDGGDCA